MILGGGINGAALARELLLNRQSVVLVDSADIASGATASSSRLIHGGLRYLEHGEFGLVRESLAERGRLLALAPQFVRPLRLYIPVERRWGGLFASALRFMGVRARAPRSRKPRGLLLVRSGLWFYDRYARDCGLPRRRMQRVESGTIPAVNKHTFRWLCSYSDAQVVYPERFVVALLRDALDIAEQYQVRFDVFTYHDAALRDGRVLLSSNSGRQNMDAKSIEPAAIVNATGAWVDKALAKLKITSPRLMGGTKGSHFVTSHGGLREALGGNGIYAEADDGRPFFILPLNDATLVGTTDLPFDADPGTAVATEQELSYLLAGVARVFPQMNLTREDIDFHYSGVRPLPYVGKQTPASITRRHWIKEQADCEPPLYSLIGGKLTTCRSLAEEAAATVLARLRQDVHVNSRERPLPGGDLYPSNPIELEQRHSQVSERTHCTRPQVQAVWQLCGALAEKMLLEEDGSVLSNEQLASIQETHLPRGFVRRVIREEWVCRLSDLVERRLMLLYYRLHESTLRELAQLLAAEGKLDEGQIDSEVEATIARLNAKYNKPVMGLASKNNKP